MGGGLLACPIARVHRGGTVGYDWAAKLHTKLHADPIGLAVEVGVESVDSTGTPKRQQKR